METFFGAIVSASLIFAWTTSAKLAVAEQPAVIAQPAVLTEPLAAAPSNICTAGAAYQVTAARNAATLGRGPVRVFGRAESGWQIYAPQIAKAIGTTCAPTTKAFAAKLASWQAKNRLPATGEVTGATLAVMKSKWQGARPFIRSFKGGCPSAAIESRLAQVGAREGWLGKISKLDPRALESLRAMAAAARAEDPRIASDKQFFQVVSAYRSPSYDAGRCARDGNCNGVARARCSAHRTGRAMDLYIGALPGQSPVSSNDANRLHMTRTPAYQWMVKNAARFGFVNYVFEPWHWEWIGTTPTPTTPETLMVVAKTEAQPAQPVLGSLAAAKPLLELSLRLRALFGSAQ